MPNTATRNITPDGYAPSSPLLVEINVVIDTSTTSTYILEDIYPTNGGQWVVSGIAPAGGVDNNTSVRWFFLDNASRLLSYTLTPHASATGPATFGGTVDSDGPGGFASVTTVGEGDPLPEGIPTTTAAPTTTGPPGSQVCRTFGTGTYTPGVDLGVTLAVTIPPGDAATYIVEEFVPFGWIPNTISDAGNFNGTSIRWFFLDAVNRNLTYNVVPPLDETATRSFAGTGMFDGGTEGFNPVPITCDTTISQGAAPPVRDLTPIGSGAAAGAGENMSSEIEHYADGSLRPPSGPDEIGALPVIRDGTALPASVSIQAGDLVNIWDDGGVAKVRLADQSDSRQAHGWADNFASIGDAAIVRTHGSVNDRLSSLTPGAEYWLAEDGEIDTDGSSTPISQKVGVAISDSALLFIPETI